MQGVREVRMEKAEGVCKAKEKMGKPDNNLNRHVKSVQSSWGKSLRVRRTIRRQRAVLRNGDTQTEAV